MAHSLPKIFISYSHDSTQYRELVLRFAQRLRKDGVDVQIDQYVDGTPEEGWLRWMLDKLDWADFVLLVWTEAYYRRFQSYDQPDIGKGLDWEGQLITLEIYNTKSLTTKFVPVIFASQDKSFVPERLSDQVYCLDSEDHYQELLSLLTGEAGLRRPELAPAKELPKEEVEPLTFGVQGEQFPIQNQPDEVDGSSPVRPAARVGSTPLVSLAYALASLILLFCAAGISGLMIENRDFLARLGLTGNLYYIVLLPIGLAAAGCLFGVLQSYSLYTGKELRASEVAAAIIGFALVVIGGVYLWFSRDAVLGASVLAAGVGAIASIVSVFAAVRRRVGITVKTGDHLIEVKGSSKEDVQKLLKAIMKDAQQRKEPREENSK